ncbi:MAG: VWA domain-containing protein, partial [Mangrovimonas sp.]|nr:VWA domain-containing protein [Mangrovimonas sp.]
NEKNKINNSKNFAVEVIDQEQRIAIVSSFIHPDLGLFKKSIESNEQREASILKPHEVLSQMDAFQLIILYQPDQSFGQVYEAIEQANKNTFTIIGAKTNINFINSHTADFALESTGQTEEYQGALNANYDNFIVDDIDFENFPPLQSPYSNLTFKRNSDVLLYKKLRSAVTQQPLLFTFEKSGRREGILLGENIWQWRAYSYLENETFNTFDDFFGKIVQYLASNKSRNRLAVDYESFYNGNSHVLISAQYFNKNYEFDSRETLNIKVENKETNERREFPFLLKNNTYQVDLSGLKAGDYNFTVQAQQENISYSGSFTILDYNVEQQFLNADVTKLHQLAANSSGKSYFIANYQQIVDDLVNDDRFKPIQKSTVNKVPLIDYKYLLFLIVSLLAIEWFTRKYNGLI